MKSRKHLSRNLRITTRVTLSTIFGIAIPLLIVFISSSIILNSITSYFNFSNVTENRYSMLNQIQWNQTMSSISNELISDDATDVKKNKIDGYVTPLEELGVKIYIECNGDAFYATTAKEEILREAEAIVKTDADININYFGENGMVIVNHANKAEENYLVIICNNRYMVPDISSRYTAQSFSSLVFSKTGKLVLIILIVFVLSATAVAFFTSRTINKPIKKLADGANEIAGGNLDYVIDYDSTNEIGQTVSAFNNMAKRLKESIEDRDRIEKSRKEMIAGAAHDLRTPLTSVKGYVEGLRDGIANTPEKQERYLDTIYSSTLAMEKMLDDLLTVSRLELGHIELNKHDTDINDFLDETASVISLELEKHGFDFNYDNRCERPCIVELDESNFIRVIQNIVSNSLKYSKKDVKGFIELSAQSYSKSVIISISDNGIGLDAKSLPRIFETFYRADKARSRVTEGSGIGLSVCRQIVELHGGHIWATGTEGEGLTVLISLQKRTNGNE